MKIKYINLYITLILMIMSFGVQAQYVFDFTSGSVLIDQGTRTLESNVEVPETVNKLTVQVDISHTWVHDLEMTLVRPDGQRLTVFRNLGKEDCFGCGGDDIVIKFLDASTKSYSELNQSCGDLPAYGGESKAFEEVDAFVTGSLNGTWYIEIKDHWPFEEGMANDVKLEFGEYEEPKCSSLIFPANGDNHVAINSLISWNESELATGYFISLGSAPGSTDFMDKTDVGAVTEFNPDVLFCGTDYYVTIAPYNIYGEAIGCDSDYFSTEFVEAACSGDVTVCLGEQTVLSATGGSNYQWLPETYLADAFGQSTVCTPEDNLIYEVIVSNENGCMDSCFIDVKIEKIVLTIDSVYHARTDLPGFILISSDDVNGNYVYNWSGPNGFTANTQDIYNLAVGCYTLKVLDPQTDCTTEIEVCVDDLTDVPFFGELKDILIYPNPAKGKMMIDFFGSKKEPCTLILSDLSGKIVYKIVRDENQQKLNIPIADYSPGFYVLQLISANQLRNQIIEIVK